MSPIENKTNKDKTVKMPFVLIETEKDTMMGDNPVHLSFNVVPRIAIVMLQDAIQQIASGKAKIQEVKK